MTQPPGWRHRHYETLASTQDLCATLATGGEPGRLAISASRQTVPRASRGRDWITLPGALAVSVLLRPTGPASDAGHWALLAAVALRAALDDPAIELKWPNDLLLGGQKLAGILIDTAVGAGQVKWLVIGFGVNLRSAPPGAASLPRDASVVMHAVLAQIDAWERRRVLDGWSAIRRAWMSAGPPSGQTLQVGTVAGTYQGLSDEGALLLQTGGRLTAFATGTVLLGP